MFSKAFIAALTLAVASLVAATPARRQAASIHCNFIATPTPAASPDSLQTSIEYAFTHTLAGQYPNAIINGEYSLIAHDDGSYDVYATDLEVDGVSSADPVTAKILSFDHASLDGNTAEWVIQAADCPV